MRPQERAKVEAEIMVRALCSSTSSHLVPSLLSSAVVYCLAFTWKQAKLLEFKNTIEAFFPSSPPPFLMALYFQVWTTKKKIWTSFQLKATHPIHIPHCGICLWTNWVSPASLIEAEGKQKSHIIDLNLTYAAWQECTYLFYYYIFPVLLLHICVGDQEC